jgi:hypothetical protein
MSDQLDVYGNPEQPKSRQPDLSWEALVEVTTANVSQERGALNAALKEIRAEEPGLDDEDLALLIRLRAEDYRRHWPEMSVTPMSLAKHWLRIRAEVERAYEAQKPPTQGPIVICPTCGGDRMIVVGVRASQNPESGFEECAPCPDCNPTVVSWWQYDGRLRRTPDPEEVRRRMR